MYGVFSNPGIGLVIRFHRLLAFIGVVAAFTFSIICFLVIPGARELMWDRIFIFGYCLYLYMYSHNANVHSRHFVYLVYIGSYLFTAQIIWALAFNDFHLFYMVMFFLTVQTCGFSFRNERQTLWYFVFVMLAVSIGIFAVANIAFIDKVFYSGLVSVTIVLSFLVSRLKCRYLYNMKIKESLMKSMVTKTENAIFLTDIYGNIVDLNNQAEEIFGYTRDELIDCDFKILRKRDLIQEEINDGLIQLRDSRFWNSQSVLLKRNGEDVPVSISISLIYSGSTKFMVYRVQDISALKEFEARILEEKEKAENAAKAKAQFLAVMSHEIRTPLNGVIATASLLQNTHLDREQTEYVDTIKKSGNSLLMLINDILEFSKMESGKMQLDPHNASVTDVLFDVMDLLRPHADAKGLKIQVQIGQDVPDKLWMDSHRLKQILMNLIGNAIKFTEKGSVSVICENAGIIKRQIKLNFIVRDTGIGIHPEKVHQLFKSFSQVDSSTSRKFGGTGLGLAISKQLVEMMEGEVKVSSNLNMGSEFNFNLKCEIGRDNHELSADNSNPQQQIEIEHMKVLVAEDNHINLQVFKYMLQNLKVETDFVHNGQEAIQMCDSKKYDLIFMDMQMPVMDGVEATRHLRSLEGHQPIVVAISANAYADDRKLCTDAGMDDFMPKPFDIDQLRNILIKWSNPRMHKLESAA
ncbi:MAG: ATP-binding protein [Flavobacteriales bacterium]